jgi:DNA-binding NarL/FixJ family response regulator
MDLQMPEMNGIDALIAIRSEFPEALIIVLTTYAGDALCKRAMKAGAQAYILKGNVRKDLLDTIRAVRKQVASSAGFGNVDVMRRAFVRLLGITPRRYRELTEHSTGERWHDD